MGGIGGDAAAAAAIEGDEHAEQEGRLSDDGEGSDDDLGRESSGSLGVDKRIPLLRQPHSQPAAKAAVEAEQLIGLSPLQQASSLQSS